jgi:SH3 domain-containing protein
MLLFAISFISDRAEPAEMKAAVSGTPTANLRAGAGVDHALRVTLKEGDQVTVEKAEGEWFLVVAADGQKGYIHKNLLKPAGETFGQSAAGQTPIQQVAAAQPKEPAKGATAPAAVGPASQSQSVASPKTGGSTKTTPAATPAAAAPQQASEAKSQSILQMIEGHEAEVKIAALVAAIAFVLGWFSGGSYYIRRERRARRRLRF